jgi:hypothetical protein
VQYTIDWKAEDLMNEAERKMVPIGYSVMNRSDHSITFSGQIAPSPSGGDRAATYLAGYFDLAAGMAGAIAQNTGQTDTTTVLFHSTPGGKTTVTIPDTASPSNTILDWWVKNELLLEPWDEPWVKIDDTPDTRVHIYTDRIERFDKNRKFGVVGWGWSHTDTIDFKKIGPVEVQRGKTVAFDYLDDRGEEKTVYLRRPKKEQAEATKVVIDGRKAVMEKYH